MEAKERPAESTAPDGPGRRRRREGDGRLAVDELVRRAQDGDADAFEGLYRECVGRIHALCLRMVADEPRARELTQRVFVRAWRKLPSFRGQGSFHGWLHRLAVNVVYHEARSRKRRRTREQRAVAGHEPRRDGSPELRVDLERAIGALPPRARVVFVLHDVEGYTHAEIGKMTGIATGTSKAHLHRAHRLLRERLTG